MFSRNNTIISRGNTTLNQGHVGDSEGGTTNDFLLIFDKTSGSPRIQYFVIDIKGRRKRVVPKVNYMSLPKVKDVIGYQVIVMNGVMFILGGKHLQSDAYLGHVYCFNPKNNQWTRRANMRRARTRFTATALDGCIYVCGGEVRGGRISDSVECYDPHTDTWTDMRCLPKATADHAACVAEGRLFVSGGVSERKGGTHSFWQYEPYSDYWSQANHRSVMPKGRERHSMVEYRGTVYVFGGVTTSRQDGVWVEQENATMFSFDCSKGNIDTRITGTWDQSLPEMNHGRCQMGCFALGGNIFCAGGRNNSQMRDVLCIEYYSIRRKQWIESFSLMPESFNLSNVDCVVLTVPTSNKEFSNLALAFNSSWIFW